MRKRVRIETGRDMLRFIEIAADIDVPVLLVDGDNEDNFVSGKSLLCVACFMNWSNLYCVCEKDISFKIRDFIIEE